MAFVFHRRLVIPLCAIAFFAVSVTAPPHATLFRIPPTTLLVVAVLGIAAIAFLMPGAGPRLHTSRAFVRVRPSGHQAYARAALTVAAGTGVRTAAEPNESTADDVLDLHRMDDDGGREIARPPA
jgi:hypothetical protein